LNRYLSLYPRAWRDRYGDELELVLEEEQPGLRARLDLVRGALDAHLHPASPSPVPVAAAITASAFAVAHAIALAAQPVPTDWPAYLDDALPLVTAAVAAMLPAIVGVWLKLGDTDGWLGRAGVLLAVGGHVLWLIALLAAATHVAYGPLTAAASAPALIGTALLGVALAGHGRFRLGGLLAVAGLAGLGPPTLGWPAFAGAWTGVAALLAAEFATPLEQSGGPRLA
jgi:hypothetical protein